MFKRFLISLFITCSIACTPFFGLAMEIDEQGGVPVINTDKKNANPEEKSSKGKRTYSATEADSVLQKNIDQNIEPSKHRKIGDVTLPSRDELKRKFQDILMRGTVDEKDIEVFKEALKIAKDNYPDLINAAEFGCLERDPILIEAAIKEGGRLPLVRALIDAEADVNAKNNNGNTALLLAAGTGKLDVVEYLAEDQRVDINAKNNNGNTVLILAADNGKLDVVKYLAEDQRVDINDKNKDGDTALMLAARNGKLDVVEYLAEDQRVDINDKNKDGDTALILAASYWGGLDVVKYLTEYPRVDINAKNKGGNTALILTASYGELDVVRYLAENPKVEINLTNKQHQTAENLAISKRRDEIAKYLSKKSEEAFLKEFKNPIKSSHLCIFIDYADEKIIRGALSKNLSKALQDKAAPCIIFGAHLLDNAKKLLPQGESDLKEIIISNLIYVDPVKGNLEVIIAIPNSYAQEQIKKDGINLKPKEIVEKLFSATDAFKEKTNEKINLDYKTTSSMIPDALNVLLADESSPKCIYLEGHGNSIGSKNFFGNINGKGLIANLYIPDALKLFSILENKNTRLLYVDTCFLGGENLLKVQDMLNSMQKNFIKEAFKKELPSQIFKAPANMIFVSGATTQAVTIQSVISFTNFFREFERYLNKEEELKRLLRLKGSKKLGPPELKNLSILAKNIGPLRAIRSYIADNITNWVTDYSVSAIPQVRFPTTDAKFYSLASTLIDEITSGKIKLSKKFANEPETFFVDNEKVLVVNVPYVDFPVVIKGQLPLLISGIGLRGFSFENITVTDSTCNLSKFVAESIIGKAMYKKVSLFSDVEYQENFSIKELRLGKVTEFKDKNISFGNVLEDVFITRTGKDNATKKECYKATFKAFDTAAGKYKYYQYKYEDNREDISQIDEVAALKGKLLSLFDSENIDQFKAALIEAQIKDPKITNSILSHAYGSNTMLGIAVVKNNFEMVKTLLGAGADVDKVDGWGSCILPLASMNQQFDLLRYLVEIAKVDIYLTDSESNAIKTLRPKIAKYLSLIRRLHKATSVSNIAFKKFSQILDETKKEFPHLLSSAAFGDSKTDTLMTLAIKKNNLRMVELLLAKGSSIDQVDNNSWTPLHHAAALGNFDMVKYLVEVAKANIGLKNKRGKTPRALACELKRTQVEIYLSLGAKCLNDMHSDDVDWVNIF
jgi:ankyrin repeat protein